MRCKNCGWENSDDAQTCVKCNSPLAGGARPSNNYSAPAAGGGAVSNLHSTVREGMSMDWNNSQPPSTGNNASSPSPSNIGQTVNEMGMHKCPKCGYPVVESMNVCPMCGTLLGNPVSEPSVATCPSCGQHVPAGSQFCPHCGTTLSMKKKSATMGTVNPWSKPQDATFFTLKPIAWDGEGKEYTPTTHSGDTIVLNRSNTDPNNNSITSKEQAVLSCEDGHWYLENRSEQKTTLLRVDRKVELHTGDVIVLGNRMFEFKAE